MVTKKDYLLIQNPVAGRQKNQGWVGVLLQKLREAGYSFDLIETKYPNHATEIAEKEAGNYHHVVAIGGDGTINEVANGLLLACEGVLGILPIGSGNDLYRSVSGKVDPAQAIENLIAQRTKKIDVGVDQKGRYVFNIASIGLDAFTTNLQHKLKKHLPGTPGYVAALLYSMLAYRKQKLRVRLDDTWIDAKNMLLCFGGGKTYGGGIQIMPWAKLDDGYFHVVNVIDLLNFALILLSPTIIFGKHPKIKRYVKVYKAKEIEIIGKDLILNIDGNIYPKEDHFLFRICPQKLEVIY